MQTFRFPLRAMGSPCALHVDASALPEAERVFADVRAEVARLEQ